MDRTSFLESMSRVAATVSIVATDGSAGPAGVTVSAMTSVSADGPSLLVCVHHQSPAAAAIIENGVFSVNVLGADQSGISDCFAGRRPAPDGDKFRCADWRRGASGAPILHRPRAAATFDCRLTSAVRTGSHYVFIGAVESSESGDGDPLIYARRSYGAPRLYAA